MENNMQVIEISLGLILYKCKFFGVQLIQISICYHPKLMVVIVFIKKGYKLPQKY